MFLKRTGSWNAQSEFWFSLAHGHAFVPGHVSAQQIDISDQPSRDKDSA